jgi:peptide/nickel transport system permease protein
MADPIIMTSPSVWQRFTSLVAHIADSDIAYNFRRSPVTMLAAAGVALILFLALFAPLIAPYDPFDPGSVDIMNADLPPAWVDGGQSAYLLGTDNQGRDILSTLMYGSRISLGVGFAAVAFSMIIGVLLGLLSGFLGGYIDAFIMRIADIQLSFPAILIALLVDGVLYGILPREMHGDFWFPILVFSIGISGWVQYARTVRGSTMVEISKEYVQAARVIGISPAKIMVRHILPNVMGPVLVIATINLAVAIITEATLSFLGVGVPITSPSLGTLIRIGGDYLYSGEWWITIFPGIVLAALALSINLLGDWLRDALNPKLR